MDGRDREWSVGELARAAGVTVRTLHHYDRIGLLRPGLRSPSGYRRYLVDDVARLQRILAYRELGLGLAQLRNLLDDPTADLVAQLRAQHGLVTARLERLRQVAAVLERTMEAHRMGINLTPEEMLEVFGEHDPTQHAEEAEQRWGDTDAYQESRRRTATYTKADWLVITAEAQQITDELVRLKRAGAGPGDAAAMDAAESHRRHISRWFYDSTTQIHRGLAQMYVADPRFTATYEQQEPGLAHFVHDAVLANADRLDATP